MAETNAHTEVPSGGHKGPFPPFQQETFASQLVWLVITFVALYVLTARVALPRIGSIVAARQKRMTDDISAAEHLKTEADETMAAYQAALADARTRAQGIAAETHNRLGQQADARRHELETQLNAKLAEAEDSIAATKRVAMSNVRSIAVDATGAIVERLIGTAPTAKTVKTAVEAALKS